MRRPLVFGIVCGAGGLVGALACLDYRNSVLSFLIAGYPLVLSLWVAVRLTRPNNVPRANRSRVSLHFVLSILSWTIVLAVGICSLYLTSFLSLPPNGYPLVVYSASALTAVGLGAGSLRLSG